MVVEGQGYIEVVIVPKRTVTLRHSKEDGSPLQFTLLTERRHELVGPLGAARGVSAARGRPARYRLFLLPLTAPLGTGWAVSSQQKRPSWSPQRRLVRCRAHTLLFCHHGPVLGGEVVLSSPVPLLSRSSAGEEEATGLALLWNLQLLMSLMDVD